MKEKLICASCNTALKGKRRSHNKSYDIDGVSVDVHVGEKGKQYLKVIYKCGSKIFNDYLYKESTNHSLKRASYLFENMRCHLNYSSFKMNVRIYSFEQAIDFFVKKKAYARFAIPSKIWVRECISDPVVMRVKH